MSTTIGKVRPVFRGEWDSEAAYAALDMVRSADGQTSYTALKDVPAGTALSNATYWDRIVDVTAAVDRITAAADSAARPLLATAADNPAQIWPDADSVLRPVTALAPVQSGSGDPSPDNVRPISGRTSVQLTRCGKNLLNPNVWGLPYTKNGVTITMNADGGLKASGTPTITSGYIFQLFCSDILDELTDGETYTHSYKIRVEYVDETLKYVSSVTIDKSTMTSVRPYIQISVNDYYDGMVLYPQLEHGSTTTDFEPYTGDTYSADFGQTVYGGTLDWNTGVLTVEWEKIKASQFSRGSLDSAGKLYKLNTASIKAPEPYTLTRGGSPYVLCSALPVRGLTDARESGEICFVHYDSSFYIGGYVGNETELDELIASEDFAVTYRLATPATIQLTPQQIAALPGLNTVFDNGDGLSVGYNKSIARMFEEVLALVTAAGGE